MRFQSVFKSLSGLWRSQVFGEGIPQVWGREAEGPVTHGAEVGVGGRNATFCIVAYTVFYLYVSQCHMSLKRKGSQLKHAENFFLVF